MDLDEADYVLHLVYITLLGDEDTEDYEAAHVPDGEICVNLQGTTVTGADLILSASVPHRHHFTVA